MITAGEVLKSKRESLGKSLDVVSKETKIQRRFLQYIENNDFSKFDSEIFLTGFIKIYSQYLDLDTNKLLALYRRSRPAYHQAISKSKRKEFKFKKFTITPKSLVTILSVLFLVLIMGYIGYQIYKFQSPPHLTIDSPINDQEINTADITIKGKTDPNSILEINGSVVSINDDGSFEKAIELQEGINVITIKSRKNANNVLETVETRKITYTPDTTEQTPVETEKTFTLTLEIKDSSSWVKLNIDNENKLEQVVQPSKTEYTVKDNFYIITGKVNNTIISVNGDTIPWKTNSTTGVAQITCKIQNQALSCE